MTAGSEYRVRLRSPAEREEKIHTSVEASKETRDFYDFRSQLIKLPLIRLAEDYLIYRMENFRTYVAQHAYLLREKKPPDYFLTGQENQSVQELQHHILAKLAKQGRANSVTPIIDVLRVEKQREPLIITYRGVVVNGNRRLAGMRELASENVIDFSGFAYVDCLVLPPDATTNEIVDIEAALQAKPETRLDYDWIGDCQLIQRLLDLGRNIDQVAIRLNRKASEITNSLSALMEANLYLRDWARAEGDYRRVEDAEQFFKDIPGLLENKAPALSDASRVLAWNLFDNRNKLRDRLYAFNPVIGKHAAQVLSQISKNLNLPIQHSKNDESESFSVDVDAGSTQSFQPVIEAFRDRDKRDEAIDTLIEVSRDVVEGERSKKGANAALRGQHIRLLLERYFF
jgi:ParB-like chromosome segregation protein Spo0J